MASYRDDELQTLGDILPRMKPLPDPPPGASEDELARTQQHNDALAQLQDNALVARHLAQNTITNGVPFPDSLLHFVPGRLLAPLAAASAGRNSDPWTDPSSTGASDNSADPWASYGKSAVAAADQTSNVTMAPVGGTVPPLSPASNPSGSEAASGNIASPPTGQSKGNMGAASSKVGFPPVLIPVPPGTDILDNMNAARAHRNDNIASKYLWFYNQVHGGGPWDYKQGGNRQYEPFGNFNYGATGRMLGISPETLQRMAGLAQIWYGTSTPAWGRNPGPLQSLLGVGGVPPYGDDPRDQMFMDRGFHYAPPPHGASGIW